MADGTFTAGRNQADTTGSVNETRHTRADVHTYMRAHTQWLRARGAAYSV